MLKKNNKLKFIIFLLLKNKAKEYRKIFCSSNKKEWKQGCDFGSNGPWLFCTKPYFMISMKGLYVKIKRTSQKQRKKL